jgi:hypothetical protein
MRRLAGRLPRHACAHAVVDAFFEQSVEVGTLVVT